MEPQSGNYRNYTGNVNLSKAITLSGQRIIQESALIANKKMNKEMKNVK